MHDAATWDLYCRVVDNHGDLGVSWRLAVGLAARGLRVRLWCDDLERLAWMAPGGAAGVTTGPWAAAAAVAPGHVVVETFGCDLPPAVLVAMAASPVPPVWIDVDHLTAEPFAARCHGLPSPQSSGPGAGLTRWFYYPGFVSDGGGLLHGADLVERQRRFDALAWLQQHGVSLRPGERVVSLFCYSTAPVPALLDRLAAEPAPTRLLATAGEATASVAATLGPSLHHGTLRATCLPFLSQTDYDHLLWASDLNLVRGEDSFVRAQLAGGPFLWQIYPQHDAAHLAKLDAFIALYSQGHKDGDWREALLAWNGAAAMEGMPPLPTAPGDAAHAAQWRADLLAQTDLVDRLIAFAASRAPSNPD